MQFHYRVAVIRIGSILHYTTEQEVQEMSVSQQRPGVSRAVIREKRPGELLGA